MRNSQEQIDDFMYRTFGYRPLRKAPAENLDGRFTDAERQALTGGRFAIRTPPPAPPPPPPPTPGAHWTTESGLNQEQHAALMRRFPRAATQTPDESDPPSLPITTLHSYLRDAMREPPTEDSEPESSSMLLNGQPAIRFKNQEEQDGYGDALRERITKRRDSRFNQNIDLVGQHAQAGTLADGSEFLNLAGLVGHQANRIAEEYVKWHESGGGPVPDLSKYENPVARYKDGSTWDYMKTFEEMTALRERAKRFDKHHVGFNSKRASKRFLSALDPQLIWSHMHAGVKKIDPDQVKRTGLLPHQYPAIVRDLVRLGLHHQRLSHLFAQGADDATDKRYEDDDYPGDDWPF